MQDVLIVREGTVSVDNLSGKRVFTDQDSSSECWNVLCEQYEQHLGNLVWGGVGVLLCSGLFLSFLIGWFLQFWFLSPCISLAMFALMWMKYFICCIICWKILLLKITSYQFFNISFSSGVITMSGKCQLSGLIFWRG